MRILTALLLAALIIPGMPAAAQNLRGFDARQASSDPPLSGVRRALIVGIDEYQDERIPRLAYAVSDAMAFAGWLRSPAAGNPVDSAVVLLNGEADQDAVMAAYRGLVEMSEPGDELIVYFSGHGGTRQVRSSTEGYLFPHDADAEDVAKRGISLNDINKEVSYLEGQNPVLLIVDACRSGNLFNANLLSTALENLGGNVRRLVSSEGGQDSMEGPQWEPGHGAFTYFLLSGLYGMADVTGNGDQNVTLAELGLWVVNNVAAETNFTQTPQVQPFDHKWVISEVVPAFRDSVEVVMAGRREDRGDRPVRVAARGAPPANDPPPPPSAAVSPAAPASAGDAAADAAAAEIRLGQTVTGRLDTSDPTMDDGSRYDVWTYDGRAGERITITMRSSQMDPYLILAREQGGELTKLSENDDGAGGTDARITMELPADATYLIYANTFSSEHVGDYMLALEVGTGIERSLPELLREAGSYPIIALGGTASGTLTDDSPLLSDQTPYEAWTFQGRAGEVIEIEMRTEDFDAYLAIGSENGSEILARDDDSAGGLDALVLFEVPTDGRYVVMANAIQQTARGGYTLRMDRGRPTSTVDALLTDQLPQARRIRSGETVTGALDRSAPLMTDRSLYHVYGYQARAGERVTVTLRSDDFDAYLGIGRKDIGSDGIWIQDDDSGGGTDSRLVLVFPEDGLYGIVANTLRAGSTGGYTLTIEDGGTGQPMMTVESLLASDAARGADLLEHGRPVAGMLEGSDLTVAPNGAFADVWRFRAAAGDRVTISMQSSEVDAYLAVGDLAGAQLAEDDDGDGGTDAKVSVSIQQDGEYVVIARSFGAGETGAYLLRSSISEGGAMQDGDALAMPALIIASLAGGTPQLQLGEPVSGMLTGDVRLEEDGSPVTPYLVTGQPGESVIVTLVSDEFDTYLVVGAIVDGEPDLLGSDDDGAGDTNSRLEFEIPASGTAVVLVNSYDEEGGSFTVRVDRAGAGTTGDIASRD